MLRLDGFLVKQLHTKDGRIIKDKYVEFAFNSNSKTGQSIVIPKQNYSKIDPLFKNLKAHKGPDEV